MHVNVMLILMHYSYITCIIYILLQLLYSNIYHQLL
ncbi:hypothetical protein ACJIZ3_005548 [Penstemon smallii]|uniref:Uncharacterized protein n=1 Tax=Penstemon smallii TaxID=265156 RepID=A0ABD3S5K4_9LAMI